MFLGLGEVEFPLDLMKNEGPRTPGYPSPPELFRKKHGFGKFEDNHETGERQILELAALCRSPNRCSAEGNVKGHKLQLPLSGTRQCQFALEDRLLSSPQKN